MSINKTINQSRLRLVKSDLTALDVEAFVFYARPDLALGAGFGNAISMRGGPAIKQELDKMEKVKLGEAVVSTAGSLNAKSIIHAVGPTFQEDNVEEKLKTTMENSLKCAEEKGITQLAFPPMGAGFYCIPLPVCAKIMVETIRNHLSGKTRLKEVIICAADDREYKPFADRLEDKS